MIKISYTDKGYYILGTGAEDEQVLFSPLHSLFLRGNLKGKPEDGGIKWFVPFGKNSAATLQRVITHLKKYGLAYELDEESSGILQDVERTRQAYQNILRNGSKAKSN